MSISVKQLSKFYGRQKALDRISLSIDAGEVVGLLGPNGAGKSTLMKILSCFLPPSDGTASVCGYDIMEHPMEVKRKVGYLPEHNPLYLDMYVKEYLRFVASIHRTSKRDARVKEMIELTGLTLEQHKKIGALSKGYRQRVGLAQALFHDPEVLIMDEPTTGLDPNQLKEIRALIKQIGQVKTILLSTHIMQEVEAVCSRLIIIHKGQIVRDGKTSDIRQASESEIIISVEFNQPVNPAGLQAITDVTSVRELSHHTWEIIAKRDVRDLIFQFAVSQGVSVLSMQKTEQTLEQIFQNLTT